LISSYGFAQSVNDYGAVIVPVKYDFLKSENQYRLNTLTKFNLQKAGFVAFYANDNIPNEYNSDRCKLLYVDVLKDSGFLVTKLYVVLKDCNGKIIYTSEIGKSKEKDFETAYSQALNNAFVSINALHYKYNGSVNTQKANSIVAPVATSAVVTTPVVATPVVANVVPASTGSDASLLFAQPIKNGYQLIDNTPKVVMKVYSTTNPTVFIATKENIQGVFISKENQWFFEYYDKEALMSEKISVKF